MNRCRAVIGAHHILMLYAHWAVNDPRGSGSEQIRDPKFKFLGDIHHGRKPDEISPRAMNCALFMNRIVNC